MSAAESEPLRLRPERGDLVRLAASVDDFAVAHGIAFADSHAFMLAAEELFANTLSHSRTPVTHIEFTIVADESSALATYSDDGSPFDPTALAEVDTTLPLENRTIGGLGIHFIRRTMSTFRYERRDGRNIVTFGRVLSHLNRSEEQL
jgi:anti-sigma regulatory factor (Ser/Thr protein kinase)